MRLVQADVLRLPAELLRGEFDLVFSSHVTAWIGEPDAWFAAAWRALRPDGAFLLAGGHPLTGFVRERPAGEARRASYSDEGPFEQEVGRSPDWNPLGEARTTVEWSWTIGTLVTAVAGAGFRITHLVECGAVDGLPGAFVLRAVRE